MTTKTIPDMLAELPPEFEESVNLYATGFYRSVEARAVIFRLQGEVAVLKAAAEKRQADGHTRECRTRLSMDGLCTCGYDDMEKVLEALK